MTVFFAWAIPANIVGKWADHTWVTTFDNRLQAHASLEAVAAAGEHLWMSWGSFHPTGGAPGHADGLLGTRDGHLPLSTCVVRSNADSVQVAAARGTVQAYGIEGVCHQVANQALFATARTGQAPLSVAGSRGYTKSIYIYRQYGRRRSAWRAKVEACADHSRFDQDIAPMYDAEDDFTARAQQVLAGRADLFERVMAMREAYQAQLDEMAVAPDLSAEAIDARHHAHLLEVAETIGREDFVAIFEHEPEDEMRLVDPAIFAASRAAPGE